MKRNTFLKLLLTVGFIPLLAPFVTYIYQTIVENWTLMDWLILYSYIYWPSYLLGLILIIFAAVSLHRDSK